MKNFLNKQREIVALLSYVALVAGLVYLVILPLIGRIHAIADQIQQEGINQEIVELRIAQLPKIQKQYQTLQSNGDLSNILLDESRAVVLIEKLEKLAENTNNKITIAVQEKAAPIVKKTTSKTTTQVAKTIMDDLPNTDYLQMKITLTGDYKSFVTFIELLEKFEYYADITAIQVNKYDESSASKKTLSNPGMFGAVQPSANVVAVKSDNLENNAITATLDTVFYTN